MEAWIPERTNAGVMVSVDGMSTADAMLSADEKSVTGPEARNGEKDHGVERKGLGLGAERGRRTETETRAGTDAGTGVEMRMASPPTVAPRKGTTKRGRRKSKRNHFRWKS